MFKLYVDTDNASFVDDPGELARMLREAAGTLSVLPDRMVSGRMRDACGHVVGRWLYDPEVEYVSDVQQ
jgi:hypothetical protein